MTQAPSYFDELVNLPFEENRPTRETAQTLQNELLFQRATQDYLWALSLINTLGMKFGSEEKFGSGYNVLPVWKKRLIAKTLVTRGAMKAVFVEHLKVIKTKPKQHS